MNKWKIKFPDNRLIEFLSRDFVEISDRPKTNGHNWSTKNKALANLDKKKKLEELFGRMEKLT